MFKIMSIPVFAVTLMMVAMSFSLSNAKPVEANEKQTKQTKLVPIEGCDYQKPAIDAERARTTKGAYYVTID